MKNKCLIVGLLIILVCSNCFSQNVLRGKFIFVDQIFLSDGYDSGRIISPVVFSSNDGNKSIYVLKGIDFFYSFSGKNAQELRNKLFPMSNIESSTYLRNNLTMKKFVVNDKCSIDFAEFDGKISVDHLGTYSLEYFYGIPKIKNKKRLKLTEKKVNVYSISSIQITK